MFCGKSLSSLLWHKSAAGWLWWWQRQNCPFEAECLQTEKTAYQLILLSQLFLGSKCRISGETPCEPAPLLPCTLYPGPRFEVPVLCCSNRPVCSSSMSSPRSLASSGADCKLHSSFQAHCVMQSALVKRAMAGASSHIGFIYSSGPSPVGAPPACASAEALEETCEPSCSHGS